MDRFEDMQPGEYRLDIEPADLASRLTVPSTVVDAEHFLTSRSDVAQHIYRLMITGNFALLAGVHPNEVDNWYLGVYIDAVQWVEIVNTRGMSQFADGGMVATKPYVSSANYIHKMSGISTSLRQAAGNALAISVQSITIDKWHLKFNICLTFHQ